jgi:predicted helicase
VFVLNSTALVILLVVAIRSKYLYYDKALLERPGTQNTFSTHEQSSNENKVIAISGEVRKEFSVIIVNRIADLEVIGRGQ